MLHNERHHDDIVNVALASCVVSWRHCQRCFGFLCCFMTTLSTLLWLLVLFHDDIVDVALASCVVSWRHCQRCFGFLCWFTVCARFSFHDLVCQSFFLVNRRWSSCRHSCLVMFGLFLMTGDIMLLWGAHVFQFLPHWLQPMWSCFSFGSPGFFRWAESWLHTCCHVFFTTRAILALY